MGRVRRRLLQIVAVLFTVAVVVLAGGAWWVTSLSESRQTDAVAASTAFAEIRARFPGIEPAFEIREARLVLVREPAADASRPAPAALHLVIWQPRERTLSRVSLPLWMSGVATEPIPLEALAGVGPRSLGTLMESKHRANELNIRLSDLKGYGRALLLDSVTADGNRVLMWNE